MDEVKPLITQEQYEKLMRRKRIALIADIVLVVVLLGIGWYVWTNFETYKALQGDVCRICEKKTGGTCYSGTIMPELDKPKKNYSYPEFELQVQN